MQTVTGAVAGIATVPCIWYYIRTIRGRKARSA